MELKVKVWMERGGALCFGRGRAELLEAIEASGSISAAAAKMGMSYRHAWSMLSASEERLGRPLVERRRGGAGGGGARLTNHARRLLAEFRAVERDLSALAREKQRGLQALLD